MILIMLHSRCWILKDTTLSTQVSAYRYDWVFHSFLRCCGKHLKSLKNIGKVRCACCLSPKCTESQPSVTLWNIWRTVSKLAHTPWQNSESRLYYKHGHLKNFKILKSQFYYFLKVLKKFFFKLFEYFRVRVFPKPVENVLFNI